jgi:hypothetical protein
MQQISITAESQKGQAPPPGPSPRTQPIGNSALFHINPREHNDKITAINISAVRTVILVLLPLSV